MYVSTPVVHPDRPAPVEPAEVNFRSLVVTEDGEKKSFVGMSRDDAAEFGIWMEEVLTFIQKSQNLMCYYRDELDEEICN